MTHYRPQTELAQRIEGICESLESGDGGVRGDFRAALAEVDALAAHRGAVDNEHSLTLTPDELHCLTCAMAGNFPERFAPIRMDLLRKLGMCHGWA